MSGQQLYEPTGPMGQLLSLNSDYESDYDTDQENDLEYERLSFDDCDD